MATAVPGLLYLYVVLTMLYTASQFMVHARQAWALCRTHLPDHLSDEQIQFHFVLGVFMVIVSGPLVFPFWFLWDAVRWIGNRFGPR